MAFIRNFIDLTKPIANFIRAYSPDNWVSLPDIMKDGSHERYGLSYLHVFVKCQAWWQHMSMSPPYPSARCMRPGVEPSLSERLAVAVDVWYRAIGANPFSLQWHYSGRAGVSNHNPHDCLLKRLFRRRSKKTSKLRVSGLCEANSPVTVTGEFPAQRTSNADNASIWWLSSCMDWAWPNGIEC